jgi:hypothetical protein
MVLFVGNPTNVDNAGFTAHTVLPFLACSLSCFIVLAILFRHIPKKLDVSGDPDVRSVLLDPVGAAIGDALLGTCLIVIIVMSFFNVQVWLPFAVSKFLWDLAWDTYKLRYLSKSALEGEKEKEDEIKAREARDREISEKFQDEQWEISKLEQLKEINRHEQWQSDELKKKSKIRAGTPPSSCSGVGGSEPIDESRRRDRSVETGTGG